MLAMRAARHDDQPDPRSADDYQPAAPERCRVAAGGQPVSRLEQGCLFDSPLALHPELVGTLHDDQVVGEAAGLEA